MDAILNTQSEKYALAMRDIKIFSECSVGLCELEILSLPFSGTITFLFDYHYFIEFINALENMRFTLMGEAKLGLQNEESFIHFQGNGTGQILVSGLLSTYFEQYQKLNFSFKTDQTALAQFISGLHKAFYEKHKIPPWKNCIFNFLDN